MEKQHAPPFKSSLNRAAGWVFGLAVLVAMAVLLPQPVQASQQGLAVQVAQAAPAASGSFASTTDVVIGCDQDGEVITAPGFGGGSVAWTCYVAGTTAVFFGASAAAGQSGESAQTLVTTSTGIGICEGGACANGSSPSIWKSPQGRGGIFACRTVGAGPTNARCNGVKP